MLILYFTHKFIQLVDAGQVFGTIGRQNMKTNLINILQPLRSKKRNRKTFTFPYSWWPWDALLRLIGPFSMPSGLCVKVIFAFGACFISLGPKYNRTNKQGELNHSQLCIQRSIKLNALDCQFSSFYTSSIKGVFANKIHAKNSNRSSKTRKWSSPAFCQ